MQFEYRNCQPDADGVNTKTCHCAEGSFILSRRSAWNVEEWEKDMVMGMRDAYGQFFLDGTFPENTLVSDKTKI